MTSPSTSPNGTGQRPNGVLVRPGIHSWTAFITVDNKDIANIVTPVELEWDHTRCLAALSAQLQNYGLLVDLVRGWERHRDGTFHARLRRQMRSAAPTMNPSQRPSE